MPGSYIYSVAEVEHLASGVVGAALAALPAILVPATLRIRGRAPFLVAALVCGAAGVVLVFEALSLVGALTGGAILLGQLVVAVVAAVAWRTAGSPRPPGARLPGRGGVAALVRAHPAVAGLAIVLGAALALQLVMGLAVAPNTWDSMTYHLSRGAYWLQQDSVGWFDGGHVRQLANPPVAEMLQTWTLAVAGGDRLASAVQWLALPGLVAVIFSGARMLGFPVAASLFAGTVFALMPQPLLQSTTTQNDLILAFFLGAGTLFGVRGIRDASRGDLVLAGMALGLAVGTKGTALAAGPSVALLFGASLWAYRPRRQVMAVGAASMAAGVLAFGAFGYVENYVESDDLFGGLSEINGRESAVPGNLARISFSFVDSPGFSSPAVDIAIGKLARNTVGDLEAPGFALKVNPDVSEDRAAYGLVGLLLLLPVLLYTAVARGSPHGRRLLGIAALLYLATFGVTAEYNPFFGRLLLGMAALGAPLLALLATKTALRTVAVLLAVAGALPVLFTNPNKPLLTPPGTPTVLSMDRLSQQTIPRGEMNGVLTRLRQLVDPDEPLGFTGNGDSWDYPLFGRSLERRVVAIPFTELTRGRIRRERVAGVLVSNYPELPPGVTGDRIGPGYWFVRGGR